MQTRTLHPANPLKSTPNPAETRPDPPPNPPFRALKTADSPPNSTQTNL